MRAVIIRHGKVDFERRKCCTSDEFNEDCDTYDRAPIGVVRSDVSEMKYEAIYVSNLVRTHETARQLFGDEEFIETDLIREVPLCAAFSFKKELPLIMWNVLGRLQWLFNIHVQKEIRRETVRRADQFIKMIIEDHKDCMIVSHGFFMHTLIRCMKKQGFRIHGTHANYSNGEYIVAELEGRG
ncbi:MAG: histidine phosphatase family protein [bacterium]|nr:histidine phosphatase family protein [bacterium]